MNLINIHCLSINLSENIALHTVSSTCAAALGLPNLNYEQGLNMQTIELIP